jgi:hypothetical protein
MGMKKLVYLLAFVVSVGSVLAGEGKSCSMKRSAKSVELTGQIACRDGEQGKDCQRVFRVANSDTTYPVCDQSKVDVEKLSQDGATLRVKGKLVHCKEGQELVIEQASKL